MRAAIEWFVARMGMRRRLRARRDESRRWRVIAALPREVKRAGEGVEARSCPGIVVVYSNGRAVVACAGMGRSAAALAVQAAMRRCRCTELISVGLAGACDPALRVGDMVRAGVVIDGKTRETVCGFEIRWVLVTAEEIASVPEKDSVDGL